MQIKYKVQVLFLSGVADEAMASDILAEVSANFLLFWMIMLSVAETVFPMRTRNLIWIVKYGETCHSEYVWRVRLPFVSWYISNNWGKLIKIEW